MKLLGVRGVFYCYIDGDVVAIWLGDKNNPESEYMTNFHKRYLESFIAALTLAKEKA